MFNLIECVEKGTFAAVALRIWSGKHANVKLINNQVVESWRTKALAPPLVSCRVADHAIAGGKAESTRKVGWCGKLPGVGIALEAFRAFTDNVKLIAIAVLPAIEKARPAPVLSVSSRNKFVPPNMPLT
jgi:hypothetical protein